MADRPADEAAGTFCVRGVADAERDARVRTAVAHAIQAGRAVLTDEAGTPVGIISAPQDRLPTEDDLEAQIRKLRRALDYVYETLCALEVSLGPQIGSSENAGLLCRAIEACKHRKQPEFDAKFVGEPRSEL